MSVVFVRGRNCGSRVRRARTRRVMIALVAVGVLSAGCTSQAPQSDSASTPVTSNQTAPAIQTTPPPRSPGSGAVVEQSPADDMYPAVAATGARGFRVTYRSTSGLDGSAVDVTGVVFAPPGPPPTGGWPVVTVGHATTGVADDCAPSGSRTLLGNTDLVNSLLQRGFVVALTDFQGLGTPDPHPYLEPNSAAFDVIDAVRAARVLIPEASTRWVAIGTSQGGQATWAAAERAADYGSDLTFLGSADLSPAADLSSYADDAGDLSLTQKLFVPLVVAGLRVLHPDLDPSAYYRGALAANQDALTSCSAAATLQKRSLITGIGKDDAAPRTPADTDRMREWLRALVLPKNRTVGPMLVIVGETDNLIEPAWTRAAVDRACALGDVIDFRVRPGEGHANPKAVPEAVSWLVDRVENRPAPDTCAPK